MRPIIIDASGDDRQIGRAHAQGALHLRPAVLDWLRAAQAAHPLEEPSVRQRVDEVVEAWHTLTPATLDQVAGTADVYELTREDLLVALLATYLDSGNRMARRHVTPEDRHGSMDGCTTLALSGPNPVLAKNRDNDVRFLDMQTVLRVEPLRGYRWLALSTAGAPGVHSSGLNEVGLCVADTHVPSSDIGPGIPRFASMMHVLQECSSTTEAVELLTTTLQMGLGTITVIDEHGEAAVVECGFRNTVATFLAAPDEKSPVGLVATNHFVHPVLSSCTLEPEDWSAAVSSRTRRATIAALLQQGRVDSTTVYEVFSSHVAFAGAQGEIGSICQHGSALRSETISTVVLDAKSRHMDLSLGHPCVGTYTRIPVRRAR